jgi:hypothetical protein
MIQHDLNQAAESGVSTPTKMPGFLELFGAQLRHADYPVATVEADRDWQMRQKPVEVRMVPRPMSSGMMPVHFYPTLFRWRLLSGARFCMALNPVIRSRGQGPYFEEDGLAMLAKVREAIIQTCVDDGASVWKGRGMARVHCIACDWETIRWPALLPVVGRHCPRCGDRIALGDKSSREPSPTAGESGE